MQSIIVRKGRESDINVLSDIFEFVNNWWMNFIFTYPHEGKTVVWDIMSACSQFCPNWCIIKYLTNL